MSGSTNPFPNLFKEFDFTAELLEDMFPELDQPEEQPQQLAQSQTLEGSEETLDLADELQAAFERQARQRFHHYVATRGIGYDIEVSGNEGQSAFVPGYIHALVMHQIALEFQGTFFVSPFTVQRNLILNELIIVHDQIIQIEVERFINLPDELQQAWRDVHIEMPAYHTIPLVWRPVELDDARLQLDLTPQIENQNNPQGQADWQPWNRVLDTSMTPTFHQRNQTRYPSIDPVVDSYTELLDADRSVEDILEDIGLNSLENLQAEGLFVQDDGASDPFLLQSNIASFTEISGREDNSLSTANIPVASPMVAPQAQVEQETQVGSQRRVSGRRNNARAQNSQPTRQQPARSARSIYRSLPNSRPEPSIPQASSAPPPAPPTVQMSTLTSGLQITPQWSPNMQPWVGPNGVSLPRVSGRQGHPVTLLSTSTQAQIDLFYSIWRPGDHVPDHIQRHVWECQVPGCTMIQKYKRDMQRHYVMEHGCAPGTTPYPYGMNGTLPRPATYNPRTRKWDIVDSDSE